MERLTFDGNFCDIAQCRELPCPHGGSCTQRKVWGKLKAYEDSGLPPEEVKRSKLEIEAGCIKAIARTYGVDINRLRKLAEADRGGRLVVHCRSYNKPRLGWCSVHLDREGPDDFCSYGVRMDGDDDVD